VKTNIKLKMTNSFTYILSINGLLFLLSLICWKFPPKKINNLYGYKTFRTMQNIDIWNFANKAFNNSLLIYAGISFIAGLVLASLGGDSLTWQPMALAILTIIVCIIKTEKSISEIYDDDGKRLKSKN